MDVHPFRHNKSDTNIPLTGKANRSSQDIISELYLVHHQETGSTVSAHTPFFDGGRSGCKNSFLCCCLDLFGNSRQTEEQNGGGIHLLCQFPGQACRAQWCRFFPLDTHPPSASQRCSARPVLVSFQGSRCLSEMFHCSLHHKRLCVAAARFGLKNRRLGLKNTFHFTAHSSTA